MNIKRIIDILKQAVQDFGKHNAPRLAAALSYYTIFSMAPLLVIGIAMAGLIYGQKAAQDQIVGQISGVVGADAASLIQTMIQNVNKPGAGIFAHRNWPDCITGGRGGSIRSTESLAQYHLGY